MTYNKKNIVIERNDVTKCNQLFQMLLCHPKGIMKEELILNLFGSESVSDPSNSLRALVFRLRKDMKNQGVEGGEIVKIRKGNYSIDPELKLHIDVIEFKQDADVALAMEDTQEKMFALGKCLTYYRGPILPKLGAEEWILPVREKYKNLFSEVMKS